MEYFYFSEILQQNCWLSLERNNVCGWFLSKIDLQVHWPVCKWTILLRPQKGNLSLLADLLFTFLCSELFNCFIDNSCIIVFSWMILNSIANYSFANKSVVDVFIFNTVRYIQKIIIMFLFLLLLVVSNDFSSIKFQCYLSSITRSISWDRKLLFCLNTAFFR